MKKCCAFITGLAIGAVVTAFLTPKTGKELQAELMEKCNDLQNKIKSYDYKDFDYSTTVETLKAKFDETKKAIEEFDWSNSKEIAQKRFVELSKSLIDLKAQFLDAKNDITRTVTEEVDKVIVSLD